MLHDVDDLRDRQAETFPDLLAEEPVAHAIARVDAEGLSLVALGIGELRVVIPQCEATEHDVAGFVLHHVRIDRLGRAGRWHCSGSVRRLRARGPR